MTLRNRRVVLTRPITAVPEARDFEVVDTPLPEPGDGQFLVRHIYLSLDPYQRPAMAGRHGGHGPLQSGHMPSAETVGQVMKSSGGKASPQAVNEILKRKLGL